MQIENVKTSTHVLADNYVDDEYDAPPVHPLDTEEKHNKLLVMKERWLDVRQAHEENRVQQAIDADFFDGLQWQAQDAEDLRERGQAPLVFNVIAQHVRWILGTERRTRVDFKVFPRGKEDNKASIHKTKLLKYVSDVNRSGYHRSLAFADAVKVGVGWLEDGIRGDPLDEPLFSRRESWRNIWLDHLSIEPDISDARYLFRAKWIDTDIATSMFPDRAAMIERAAVSSGLLSTEDDDDIPYTGLYANDELLGLAGTGGRASFNQGFQVGNRRSRVRLIECWYRQPQKVKLFRGNMHSMMNPNTIETLNFHQGSEVSGELSPDDPRSQFINDGLASTYDSVRMKVWVSIFCDDGLLQDMQSPYKHDRFPFTPVWAFRRDRDNMPYGVVRNMRDAQEDFNKRRSKALFILSTNKVTADDDAVEDWDELADQVARPDGIIKKRPGSFLETDTETSLAQEHVNLMSLDENYLEKSSGVTEENRGQQTNAMSGAAIGLRQSQGSVVTADLFDNLRYALQLQGEIDLSLVEQYYRAPKIVRITNDDGQSSFSNINTPFENEQGDIEVENDITRSKSDFVVDSQDYRESVRMAMFESVMDLLGQMQPEIALKLLDMAIDLADIPNREEWVRRIRQINGMVDPESENAEELMAEKERQEQEELDRQREGEDIEKDLNRAKAEKLRSDSSKSQGDMTKLATEIAMILASTPGIAASIDELVTSFAEADTTPTADAADNVVELPRPPAPETGDLFEPQPPQVAGVTENA